MYPFLIILLLSVLLRLSAEIETPYNDVLLCISSQPHVQCCRIDDLQTIHTIEISKHCKSELDLLCLVSGSRVNKLQHTGQILACSLFLYNPQVFTFLKNC